MARITVRHPKQTFANFRSWPINQLLERSPGAFGADSTAPPAVDLKELHAKIGQLALENDFLAGALTMAGMLSAKR